MIAELPEKAALIFHDRPATSSLFSSIWAIRRPAANTPGSFLLELLFEVGQKVIEHELHVGQSTGMREKPTSAVLAGENVVDKPSHRREAVVPLLHFNFVVSHSYGHLVVIAGQPQLQGIRHAPVHGQRDPQLLADPFDTNLRVDKDRKCLARHPLEIENAEPT